MILTFRNIFDFCMRIMLYEFEIGGYRMSLFGVSLFTLLIWNICRTVSACMGWDDDYDDGSDDEI